MLLLWMQYSHSCPDEVKRPRPSSSRRYQLQRRVTWVHSQNGNDRDSSSTAIGARLVLPQSQSVPTYIPRSSADVTVVIYVRDYPGKRRMVPGYIR